MFRALLCVLAACGVALCLAGCIAPGDPKAQAVARSAVDQLRKGDLKALEAQSGPEMRTPESRARLGPLASLFPPGQPLSVATTGWNSSVTAGRPSTLTVTERYDFPDRVVIAAVTMSKAPGPKAWIVRGINIRVAMKDPNARPPGAPPSSRPPTARPPADQTIAV